MALRPDGTPRCCRCPRAAVLNFHPIRGALVTTNLLKVSSVWIRNKQEKKKRTPGAEVMAALAPSPAL